MKQVIGFLVAFFVAEVSLVFAQDNREITLSQLYRAWHAELDLNPLANGRMMVSTNIGSANLRSVVSEIMNRRLDMAMFLCNKIVEEGTIDYRDARLLNATAGIYWFIIEGTAQHTQDVTTNLQKSAASFSLSWKAGKYSQTEVADAVSKAYSSLAEKENNVKLDSMDLLPIRRYGLFAIPDLIHQIQTQNSKHALAALLIICGDRITYADYLENTDSQFVNREAKIAKAIEQIRQFPGIDAPTNELASRLRASLKLAGWSK